MGATLLASKSIGEHDTVPQPRKWRTVSARNGCLGSLVLALGCAFCAMVPSVSRAASCDDARCDEPVAAESARGIALGTGVRAGSVSTSALAYSPAGLALGKLYHAEGSVDYIPDAKGVALGAGVVDSSTSQLGAGIGLRGFLSGEGGWGGLDGRIGLAFPFSEAFAVGLAGRYITLSRDDADGSTTLVRNFTMDASFRILPAQGFQLDVAAYNFIPTDTPYAPVGLGGSLAFSPTQGLALGADLVADMTTFSTPELLVGGGIEVVAGTSLPLRVGYSFDTGRQIHNVTGGIGYTDQSVGVDLSVRQQVSSGDTRDATLDTRVIGALRYYVQ